jgi:LPS-assembly protein
MRLAALLLALAFALPAAAQDTAPAPAALIADSVAFDATGNRLTAAGNVEILHEGTRLRATRVIYDGRTDRVTVEGPLYLIEPAGTVLIADFAELSTDLQDGVLRGARLVLDRQLQLAAAEIDRVGGRYTQLNRTVVSSCRICAGNPTPLWEIRARRVIHDQLERQLYFEHAQFRMGGVPLAYLPRLRLPDPTVERATGFLIPKFHSSDTLGTGLKLPYFITLGDHADLTLTPSFTSKNSQTLEFRYRRAFARGALEVEGAISQDELTSHPARGYLFVEGSQDLARGFRAEYHLELASDPGYLLQYGFSDKDRLDSRFLLTRTRRDEHVSAEIVGFQSLRNTESNETIPVVVADSTWIRRFTPALIGGQATLSFSTHGHARRSTTDIVGRDVLRASAEAEWRRSWITGPGLVFTGLAGVAADLYSVRQDSTYPSTVERVTPIAAVELRWPLARQTARASHLLEPIAQVVWTPDRLTRVPNEDSVLVEFDETNLFSLNRFAGIDGRERGLRANLGFHYTRTAASGWSLGLAAGRVFRADDLGQFTAASGLSGTSSDWVTALNLSFGNRLSLINRAVFDDDFTVSKHEMRLAWHGEKVDLASSYIALDQDLAEGMTRDAAEWTLDAAYQVQDNWRARANWRYDFVTDRATRAGLGLTYENECIAVDLSLSRRFTSSTNVNASTNFVLSIGLNGFGDRGRQGAVRTCSG